MDKPDNANLVQEGRATIYTPSNVFYNPVQEFNRDLTIAVISEHIKDHFSKKREKFQKDQPDTEIPTDLLDPEEVGVVYEDGVKILEALAASGLRSVRFALEIAGVKQIVTNDFDEKAVKFISRNVAHNQVEQLITASLDDASMVMYRNRKFGERFDVIDLDPYGTAAPFLDGAVQSIKDGGLLCITCTDMAVLAGNAPETCHCKYQSVSLRAKYCHEQALRILLQCVESHANRYSRYIVPLISVSADFYIRVFLRVYTGQSIAKHGICKNSMIYNCVSCGHFTLQPLATKTATSTQGDFKFSPANAPNTTEKCLVCNSRQTIGGPIWNEPIHDVPFVKRVISRVTDDREKFGTADRIRGVLSVISEELQGIPLYYIFDELNKIIHCTPMTILEFRSALLHAGYKVSFSHCKKTSVKTDAPMDVIWDIYRCWVRSHPVKESRLKPGTAAEVILSKEPTIEANFEEHPDANPPSRKQGLLRWQHNPERDWGPKARATRGENADLAIRRQKGNEKANRKKRKGNDDEKKEIDFKQFPCKRHKVGECDLGEECRYSHNFVAQGTEETDVAMETESENGGENVSTGKS